MDFDTALKNLGLSNREALVYVAALELGAASVQTLSRRAGVVRSTTYLVLEDLMSRGLISTFTKGKKKPFTQPNLRDN